MLLDGTKLYFNWIIKKKKIFISILLVVFSKYLSFYALFFSFGNFTLKFISLISALHSQLQDYLPLFFLIFLTFLDYIGYIKVIIQHQFYFFEVCFLKVFLKALAPKDYIYFKHFSFIAQLRFLNIDNCFIFFSKHGVTTIADTFRLYDPYNKWTNGWDWAKKQQEW